jgi:hypothetical protein
MSASMADSSPMPSVFLPFAISLCLTVFADRQLKVIQGLFSELAWRAHGGILLDLGFFDLHLQSVAWAMLWASIAVFWMSKILRSPCRTLS